MTKGRVLNSWKEIANYLGRGVRTVQRYERELGLPVRRPHGRSRSAVIALSDELDVWLRAAPKNELEPKGAELSKANVVRVQQVITESNELRDRCHELRRAHGAVVHTLMAQVETMMHLISVNGERRAVSEEREPLAGGESSSRSWRRASLTARI
jgi:hypothetical protein